MAAPASAPSLGNNPLSAIGAELARAMRAVRAGLRLSLRTMAGRIGLPLVLLHVILTLFGSWLAPYSPSGFQSYPVEGAEAVEEAQSDPNFIAFSTTGRMPNDPTRLALIQFYESQISAVDEAGVLDLDRARANLAEVEAGWTDDQKAYVDKQREQLHQLEGPSRKFWFGTDQFGRDILSRVMSGATSLVVVSVAGAALGIILGTVVGMTSGFLGGRRDEVIMRIMDGLMSFPSLLIALLVLNSLGPSGVNIVATVGIVFMAPASRVMRSVTLSVKSLEFVESARLRGEPTAYITFREILPNAVPVLAVEASVRFSYAILLVASLGFLGLGVQPPSSDWGLMISESRRFIVAAPWVAIAPAMAVATLVVGVNLLADGIRQARELPVKEA